MNKKEFTKIVTSTIKTMNLTDADLEKGREFAVGFLIGDIYKQLEIIDYLKKPCLLKYNKKELKITLFSKFKKQFVKIVDVKSDDNG